MARIFISHSSKDAEQAEMLMAWLREAKYEPFLDSDKELGISAGGDWNEQLKIRLEECKVLIPVCSRNFRESDWCRYEADIAYHRGKDIIPVIIDDSEPIRILSSLQAISLYKRPEDARERLLNGLKRILHAEEGRRWDVHRRPYPGLDPFLEADELIFFGRQREVMEGVQTLRTLRRERDAALLMVIGASGSGKSSLVRAGILPRIKRDSEEWIVLDPFRPGQDPLRELIDKIAVVFEESGDKQQRLLLPEKLEQATEESFADVVDSLRSVTRKKEAVVLVSIDQFEEMLDIDAMAASLTPRQKFLRFIRTILDGQLCSGKVVFVGTLRSDFLDVFQSNPSLKGLKYKEFILRPMAEDNFRQIIEEPAKIAGIRIEPELVDMMMLDTETGDALPLLAFTLRELWETKANVPRDGLHSPVLMKSDYLEMGGLEGAIEKRAEEIFREHCPPQDQNMLRDAFLQMVKSNADIDEVGWVKRPARWNEMPASSHDILDRYVLARLLVKKKDEAGILIEPTHEALLRNWARLRQWIREENDFLLWRDRFNLDFVQWRDSVAPIKDYLTGAKLIEAEKWIEKFSDNSKEKLFIRKSIALRRRLRQLRIALVAGLFGGLIYTFGLWQNAEEVQADQFRIRQLATVETDPFASGIAGLAAMGRFFLRPGLNYQVARGLEQVLDLNLARTDRVATQLNTISAMVTLADGRLIAAGARGMEASLMAMQLDAKGSPVLDSQPFGTTQTTIVRLSAGGDRNQFFSLGYDGNAGEGRGIYLIRWSWPDGKDRPDPNPDRQEILTSLAINQNSLFFVPGPDPAVLACGGTGDTLYVWSGGKVAQTQPGVPCPTAVADAGNGTLVTAHGAAPLRQWRLIRAPGTTTLQPMGSLPNDAPLTAITAFQRGGHRYLVGGGADGRLRVWKDDRQIQSIDPQGSGQGMITAVAPLPNGDVVTGDEHSLVRWWQWAPEGDGALQPASGKPFQTSQEAIVGFLPSPTPQDSLPTLMSAGADGSIRLLAHQRYPLGQHLLVPPNAASLAALADLGKGLVVSGYDNGSLCWWDLAIRPQAQPQPLCETLPGKAKPTALLPWGGHQHLVAATSDGLLRWWNRNREVIDTSSPSAGRSAISAMIPGGGSGLITGDGEGRLRWWTSQGKDNGESLVSGPSGPVVHLVSLGGDRFVSVSGPASEEVLRWWRDRTVVASSELPGRQSASGRANQQVGHSRLTSLVQWRQDQLISGGAEGAIQLWSKGKPSGSPLKTDQAAVHALLVLRSHPFQRPVLLTAGDGGKISIWNSGLVAEEPGFQPNHETLAMPQGQIRSLMEDEEGNLISGDLDGSLKVIAPGRVVAAVCELYQPLVAKPNTKSEKKAAKLCACQVPDQWWKVWSWLCFGWNLLT